MQTSHNQVDEVEKMLHCRDPKCGFLTYKCPECSLLKLFRCRVRVEFAPQCGKKHADL
ncbi:MAG: transposase zinc-binding domain-containing protein [Nitrososphaerota archaeon]|nr:transposase zinc-binding domain-containing protein [Nitrososphaerota archaeon]